MAPTWRPSSPAGLLDDILPTSSLILGIQADSWTTHILGNTLLVSVAVQWLMEDPSEGKGLHKTSNIKSNLRHLVRIYEEPSLFLNFKPSGWWSGKS
jgi:hypothetical protein